MYNLDASQGYDEVWRNTISKGYILYGILYVTFPKWHHYRTGEEFSGCQGLEMGREKVCACYQKCNSRETFVIIEWF